MVGGCLRVSEDRLLARTHKSDGARQARDYIVAEAFL